MPCSSISRTSSRTHYKNSPRIKDQTAGKIHFLPAVFLQKSSGKTSRENRACCQFVVKMLSKPEMSTNFGEMSTSKVRKKPDFSGFLCGSGDPIRTDDRSGMNRLLWPTELHRHSRDIITDESRCVKMFLQVSELWTLCAYYMSREMIPTPAAKLRRFAVKVKTSRRPRGISRHFFV